MDKRVKDQLNQHDMKVLFIVLVLSVLIQACGQSADKETSQDIPAQEVLYEVNQDSVRVSTSQELPGEEVQNEGCLDKSITAVRLLGRTPHVPFAIIDKDTIFSAGQACCAEWAASKDTWYNLNEWGEIVGNSKITGGFGYDVTQCFELELTTIEGNDGIGLFVSKPVSINFPDSLRWQPTIEQAKSFDSFINSLENLIIDRTQQNFVDPAFKGKGLYFKVRIGNGWFDTLRCVVFGKRYLVIAYLDKNDNWVLAYLDNRNTNDPIATYHPFALMDIDKDGIPEIFYQDNQGYIFWDKILKLDFGYYIDDWKVVAESVGGATI